MLCKNLLELSNSIKFPWGAGNPGPGVGEPREIRTKQLREVDFRCAIVIVTIPVDDVARESHCHACMHARVFARMRACMYARMHVRMRARMHTCIYHDLRIHVCVYVTVGMHASMYVRMHACMYVHFQPQSSDKHQTHKVRPQPMLNSYKSITANITTVHDISTGVAKNQERPLRINKNNDSQAPQIKHHIFHRMLKHIKHTPKKALILTPVFARKSLLGEF